jgi:hypothetical protein
MVRVDVTVFVKGLVLLGLSDVWSVIRKASSAALARVFKEWMPTQQRDFFDSLLEVGISLCCGPAMTAHGFLDPIKQEIYILILTLCYGVKKP